MKLLVLLLFFLISTDVYAGARLDKIIGNDDLVVVDTSLTNLPNQYKNLVDAFGLISNACTATHIGNGYVLTAGHCFWAKNELELDVDCTGITVKWGLRVGASAYMQSNCQQIVAMLKDATNDFAIFKVDTIPSAVVDVELNRKVQVGDGLTLFSHPLNLSLRWSNNCKALSSEGVKFFEGFLLHDCDTNSGSSGAVLIDNSNNKIVGIHVGGRTSSMGVGVNYATYLTNSLLQSELRKLGFR